MLGISTSYFASRHLSIYDSVKHAYDLGFRLIELGANHDYEENIWETLEKIATDFSNVFFTQHCYFPPAFKTSTQNNLAEGLTKNNLLIIKTIFKAAKILKPKVISFHSGVNRKFKFSGEYKSFKGFKKFDSFGEINLETARKNIQKYIDRVMFLTTESSTKIAIENTFMTSGEESILQTPEDFKTFLNFNPELTFLLDYGHATLSTNKPEQFFSLGNKIIEIHLHDVSVKKLDHRILGTGIVDLDKLFSEVKKLKITPYIILEHSGEPEETDILKEKDLVESYLT